MHNQQLIGYIKAKLQTGASEEEIKEALVSNGWALGDIDAAFSAALAPVPPAPTTPIAETNQVLSQSNKPKLKSFGRLFGEAKSIYISKFGRLIGIMAIPFIFSLISLFTYNIYLAIFSVIVQVALSFIAGIAVVYAISSDSGIMDSYRKAFRSLWSYIWLIILGGIITFGGFVMGIVPGIIFSIWFSLSLLVFIIEGDKGLNALLKSKAYVKGYWWSLWWKLSLFGLVTGAIYFLAGIGTFLLSLSIGDNNITSWIEPILNIFIIPFGVAYGFSIYKNFTELRPGLVNQKVIAKKGFWIFSAILGILAPVLIIPIIVILFVTALNPQGTLAKARDTQRLSDLASLKTALVIYVTTGNNLSCEPNKLYKSFEGTNAVDGTGWIPVDLTKLTGGAPINELPLDPANNANYHYIFACDPNTQTFELNTALESSDFGPGGISDKTVRDGGNNPNIYEVGTDLNILK